MLPDPPPIGGGVGRGEACNDATRRPAEIAGDAPGQPDLRVERAQQPLHVGNRAFHLDDEEKPRWRMPRQQVDAPALAVSRIRHLCRREPADGFEASLQAILEGCVRRVQKPQQLATAPAPFEGQAQTGLSADSGERSPLQRFPAARLDSRDHRLAHAGVSRKVGLSPARAMSQGSDRLSDPSFVHGDRIDGDPYRRLTEDRRFARRRAACHHPAAMRLPHFPLHVVLFPHLPLPLHIFEARYRAMTRDVLADGSPYGGRFVVSLITAGSDVGDDEVPVTGSVGTVAEVRRAERFANGRWALVVVGAERVGLGAVDRSGAYALVEADVLPETVGDAALAAELLPQVQVALDAYMETVKRFVASAASVGRESQEITDVAASLDEVLKPIRLPDDPLAASYAVAGLLQIELTRKQQLLELPDGASRLSAELHLLRREARLLADGAMPPVSREDLRYNPN